MFNKQVSYPTSPRLRLRQPVVGEQYDNGPLDDLYNQHAQDDPSHPLYKLYQNRPQLASAVHAPFKRNRLVYAMALIGFVLFGVLFYFIVTQGL